jgi:hypothetical protein
MEEVRNAYKSLFGMTEGKSFRRPKRRWEDYINK